MAILFDAVGSSSVAYFSASAVTPATFNHVCSGENRVLFVFATSNGGTEGNWTATYNGASMTRIGPTVAPSFASQLWGIIAPASGNNTVSVSHDVAGGTFLVNSISYTGVDQTTGWTNFITGSSGTGTNPSVTLNSSVGSVVVDFLFSRASITSTNQTATQRARFSQGAAGQAIGETPGASSVTTGWTVVASGDANYDYALSLIEATTPSPNYTGSPIILGTANTRPMIISSQGKPIIIR